MSIVAFSRGMAKLDSFCDYSPISPVSNLVVIFQKCVLACIDQEIVKNNHYYHHISEKSLIKSFALLLPCGFIIVAIYKFLRSLSFVDHAGLARVIETNPSQVIFDNKKIAADRGDVLCQYQVAECYYNGSSPVTKNDENAVKYYRLAAHQGHVLALIRLADCYYLGEGTQKNPLIAAYYYGIAADLGNAEAKNKLGCLYLFGEGVGEDVEKAIQLFNQAASQNYPDAHYNLGLCYLEGRGTPKSIEIAMNEFQMAASAPSGHLDAQYYLAKCNEEQGFYSIAEFHYKAVADKGHMNAQNALGHLYLRDDREGVFQDIGAALHYLELAAAKDHYQARSVLGRYYYFNGEYDKAVDYLEKAARQGDKEAQYLIAHCYVSGLGVAPNYLLAMEFFEKAALQGQKESCYYLAVCSEQGHFGVEINYARAIEMYRQAAELGDLNAICRLADCYAEGLLGLEVDLEDAEYYYFKGAMQNDPHSQYNLAILYELKSRQTIDIQNEDDEEVDYDAKALLFYQKAADQNHEKARERLEVLTNRVSGSVPVIERFTPPFLPCFSAGETEDQTTFARVVEALAQRDLSSLTFEQFSAIVLGRDFLAIPSADPTRSLASESVVSILAKALRVAAERTFI